MSLVILVCGGRDFSDRRFLFAALDRVHAKRGIDAIVHGAARGADLLAEEWAKIRRVPYHGYPAEWERFGRAAGHMRNAQMLADELIDGVVAFPGGAGTANMVTQALEKEIPVWDLRTRTPE